jgi:hypothetical protein
MGRKTTINAALWEKYNRLKRGPWKNVRQGKKNICGKAPGICPGGVAAVP